MVTVALVVAAWLLIACFVIALCRAAAMADERISRAHRDPRGPP